MSINWNGVIITGASKGFGRAIALTIAKELLNPLHFILTSRKLSDLTKIKEEILAIRNTNNTIIDLYEYDLNDFSNISVLSDNLFNKSFVNYNKLYFFNNAGSLGPLRVIDDKLTVNEINETFNININSSLYLSAQLAGKFRNGSYPETLTKLFLINVSSLAAVQAFDTWGLYCTAKASREMFHKTIAIENPIKSTNKSNIYILNYCPGPLDTDMQTSIQTCDTVNEDIRNYYVNLKSNNQMVNPFDSAIKLVKILLKELFESGGRIDYYDVVEGIDTPATNNVIRCAGGDACSCGVDCQCKVAGKPQCNSCSCAVTKKSCTCSICGDNCQCGSTCDCSTNPTTQPASCCGNTTCSCSGNCQCGSSCDCSTSTATQPASCCGNTTCSCSDNCQCGATCVCKVKDNSTTNTCCGGTNCSCGEDCQCTNGCKCNESI